MGGGVGLTTAAAVPVAVVGLVVPPPGEAMLLCVFGSTPVTRPQRRPLPPCLLLSLASSSSSRCFRSLDRDVDVSGYPLYRPRPIMRFRRFLSSINPPMTEQTNSTIIPITKPATAPPLIPPAPPSLLLGSLISGEKVGVVEGGGFFMRTVVEIGGTVVFGGTVGSVAIGGLTGATVVIGLGITTGGAGCAIVDLREGRMRRLW
ncbi:MAG: hypothetical protein J3R72DRAFT_457191 [Linnemannia gamsii]|nr:MAG: hypothetical protein J3R72DRAFT_457191 [Linnemannia gamsii]